MIQLCVVIFVLSLLTMCLMARLYRMVCGTYKRLKKKLIVYHVGNILKILIQEWLEINIIGQ